MPDKEVNTIQDLIFFQYAKIIAKSAMCGKGNLNGDGRLDVLDIDAIISRGNGLTSNPIQNQGG